METTLDIQRKRLQLRAWRRGFKEADLILGRFADARLAGMSADEVAQFEALLDEADGDIYDWYLGRQPLPAEFDTPLFAAIKAFPVADHAADGDGPGAT